MPPKSGFPAPLFGGWLREQRGKRSHEQVARDLRKWLAPLGMKVPPSQLVKWEQGRVPDWPQLGAISHVYRVTFDELVDRLLAAIRVDASPGLLTHVDRLERKRLRGGEKSAAGADALRTSTQDHPSLPTASPLPASDTRGPFKEAPGGDANHLIPDRIHAAALEQARRAYEAAAADTRAVAKQLGKYIGRITADQARKHSAGPRHRAPAKPARAARDGD